MVTKAWKVVAIGAASLFACFAQAATVLVGNGVEWSWTSSDVGGDPGSFTLHADVSGSTLGTGDIRLAAFQIKNNGAGFVFGSTSVAGGGWTWVDDAELSAGGCGVTGGDKNQFCFDAVNIASSVTDDSDFDLTVNFDFASGVLPGSLELKVQWAKYDACGSFHFVGTGSSKVKVCDPKWEKIDDLISANFDVTREVPIPGTLSLFGLGLVGLGAIRRKKAA